MLSSKTALVTGAAQGIGLAVSRLLLRHGAKVSSHILPGILLTAGNTCTTLIYIFGYTLWVKCPCLTYLRTWLRARTFSSVFRLKPLMHIASVACPIIPACVFIGEHAGCL